MQGTCQSLPKSSGKLTRPAVFIAAFVLLSSGCQRAAVPSRPEVEAEPRPIVEQVDGMPWVRVAADRAGFAVEPSGRVFRPWGVNYDHDPRGRLIEDYWIDEW